MKVLFISRKNSQGYGGLSRFYAQLSSRFPKSILKPDLIHLCDATLLPLGFILKLIYRKPLTVSVHGLDLVYPNRLYQTILHSLLPKADAVIAVSSATQALLKPFNINKSKLFTIPNGISTIHLNSPTLIDFPNLRGKIVLLTVGNLVLRKGHVWFIRKVFRKLSSQFIYIIVGEGSQREVIKRTIERLRLTSRVNLVSRVDNSELAYLYQTAHIYVCPNQAIEGDFEGFGIACGEAALMGLPVVASNVDGIPQVIRDGKNGILVESTPQAFIEAINRLKSPVIRKKLGQKAKIYTQKHYSWQKTIREYTKIFQEVVGKN
ncbi:MAG: glycosyltransferase family 4 protein [Candidatus Daviesbacteria bacterium]|nr:glycosyltransferase family 4 protein [Candidatus Daviesbacteria bacterium]